jgi:hypothetical protein
MKGGRVNAGGEGAGGGAAGRRVAGGSPAGRRAGGRADAGGAKSPGRKLGKLVVKKQPKACPIRLEGSARGGRG